MPVRYLTLLPAAAAVVAASPRPTTQSRSNCAWANDTGQWGGDIDTAKVVLSKEECCALCWASSLCQAADLAQPNASGAGLCHLKSEDSPAARKDGSISCVPKRPPTPSKLARPTPEQLAWQDFELGAHIPLTMGEYGELQNDYACENQSVALPTPDMFNPQRLNMTEWMRSVKDYGGKYAVLTVQTGCGFLLHHTKSRLPDGAPYNYTIAQSPLKTRDILGEFVAAASAAGIRAGVYYLMNKNTFLQTDQGKVGTIGTNKTGTISVTQEQYETIVLTHLEEIWSGYGDLAELWFDGGTMDLVLAPKVTTLLAKLQPKALCFQGPTSKQAVRWAGSESGSAPEPNWSTAKNSVSFGSGDPNAAIWAPSESDVTLSSTGEWYWKPGQPIKSLPYMAQVYERTVGHNSNLFLNFAVDYSGQLPLESIQRYKELGDWIRGCYGNPVATLAAAPINVSSGGNVTMLVSSSEPIGRVVLMEDQRQGQRIRSFKVEIMHSTVEKHSSGDAWETVLTAQSIGHKRIIALNTSSVLAKVRLTMLESIGTATIRSMAVFASKGCALAPAPPAVPCELVENYEYKGVAINTFSGQNVSGCCDACRKDMHCVGFARKVSGQCELFKALSGSSVVNGSTSGSPTH
jgi:alpha-L-fucosidase|eukprot:COSAG02_NODE_2701_length_8203_cov_7.719521_12_plen_633_part_00